MRMSTSHGAGTAKVRPVNDDFEAETAEARPVTTAEAAAPEAVAAQPEKKKGGRRMMLPILGLALLAAAGWYGYQWWTHGRFMISTDDAYIEGDIASISPKVSGYVAAVNVVANQTVKAGDPLVTLDDGDYRLAKEQAEAQIATQKLALDRIDAQIDGAKASLAQADGRTAIRFTQSPGSRQMRLSIRSDKPITSASVNGYATAMQAKRLIVAWSAPGRSAEVLLQAPADAKLDIKAVELTDGWPKDAAPLPPRPADAMAWGDSDATVSSLTLR